jgi:hypothetical protein
VTERNGAARDGSMHPAYQRDLCQRDFREKDHHESGRRRWIRSIAAISAAILLLAQTVGVAHFHPLPSQHKYLTSAAVSVEDGLCALCLVRFHSPAALIVAPHPTAPVLAELTVGCAASTEPRSSYRSHRFGRAPPAPV